MWGRPFSHLGSHFQGEVSVCPRDSMQQRLEWHQGMWLYRSPGQPHDQALPGSSAATPFPLLLRFPLDTVSQGHSRCPRGCDHVSTDVAGAIALAVTSPTSQLCVGFGPRQCPQKGRPGRGRHCWGAHCWGLCQGPCQGCLTLRPALGVVLPGRTQEDGPFGVALGRCP